jgi:acyl-coenzyme A synthetase/AMP-(fatty) acid ligase
MNVVDPILFQCRWQPFALALCAPGTIFNTVTYGRLAQMIHNVGRNAREHGLVRGNMAALLIKDPILHAAFILGLTKIGVVPVSPRELILPKELRVDAIFADASCSLGDQHATVIDKNWTMGAGVPSDDGAQADSSDDEPCRIVLTSGTTGHPKATVRTTRLVYARLQRFQTVYGSRFPECSRIFIDVGMATGKNAMLVSSN